MKIDFHTHSHYSKDAWNSIETLLDGAVRCGLGGLALTDHNTARGWEKAEQYAKGKKLGIHFIRGMEIKTEFGDLIGYFLTEEVKSREFASACDEIHEQGGFAVIPHPFDYLRKSACNPKNLPKELLRQVDGIEAFNSRCPLLSMNEKALQFSNASKIGLQTGGSDGHFPFEIGGGFGQIPDSLEPALALRRGLVKPGGKLALPFVHGPTSLLKTLRKFGICTPKI